MNAEQMTECRHLEVVCRKHLTARLGHEPSVMEVRWLLATQLQAHSRLSRRDAMEVAAEVQHAR